MPLEHFSSGVVLFVSDEEMDSPNPEITYSVKWDRMMKDVGKYKRRPKRAVVTRNKEGDGYEVHLFAPLLHHKQGVTVEQTKHSTWAAITDIHGSIL